MNKKLRVGLIIMLSVGLIFLFTELMSSQPIKNSLALEAKNVFMDGTTEEIKAYLEKPGSKINISNYYSLIRREGYDILELLFEKYKLDPDYGFKNKGGTPLLFAAKNFKPKAVEILIKYGAEVNYQDPNGVTPLIATSYTTHEHENPKSMEITKMLVEAGADVNVVSEFGRNPIAGALFGTDNLSRLDYLIKKGADPKKLNRSASSYMVYCDTVDCVRYFVDLGLNINHLNNSGISLLQSSALSRFKTVTEINQLLELGADLCHLDNDGNSILEHMDETSLLPQDIEKKGDFYKEKVKENRQSEVYQFLEKEYKEHC